MPRESVRVDRKSKLRVAHALHECELVGSQRQCRCDGAIGCRTRFQTPGCRRLFWVFNWCGAKICFLLQWRAPSIHRTAVKAFVRGCVCSFIDASPSSLVSIDFPLPHALTLRVTVFWCGSEQPIVALAATRPNRVTPSLREVRHSRFRTNLGRTAG